MRRRCRSVCAAVVVISFCCLEASAATLRGADPARAALYSAAAASGAFSCQDGSARIPALALNDNYCDCADGSDEPGTSACASGGFYCRNRGHQALVLNSSFVDDGVCDCCDGSDEQRGVCSNTCSEQGRAAREALQAAAKEAGTGNKVRRQRARDAVAAKSGWRTRLQAIKQEEDELRPKVKALEDKKKTAEQREQKARDAKEKRDAATAAAKEAAEKAQAAAEAPEAAEQKEAAGSRDPVQMPGAEEEAALAEGRAAAPGEQPSAAQEAEDAEAAARAAAAAEDPAGNEKARSAEQAAGGFGSVQYDTSPEALAAATKAMEEAAAKQRMKAAEAIAAEQPEATAQTDEERAKERMAQWVKPEASSPEEQAAALDGAEGAAEEGEEAQAAEEYAAEEDAAEEAAEEAATEGEEGEDAELEGLEEGGDAAAGSAPARPRTQLKPGLGGSLQKGIEWALGLFGRGTNAGGGGGALAAAEGATHAARDAWSAQNQKLSGLESERQGLETKLDRDYGAEDVFLALDGQCFSMQADKYTYEVCPYGSALQRDGGSHTSLGTFQRFDDGYRFMVYEQGAGCWQGPARSIKLELSCGAKEEVSAVAEPSRCVYSAKLKTPSVCTKVLQEKLQAEADVAQRELDDIGKDEL